MEVFGPQEAHHGLVWVGGENSILFYAVYGRIAGLNPIWEQTMMTKVVRISKRFGLHKNLLKTKGIVFNLWFI